MRAAARAEVPVNGSPRRKSFRFEPSVDVDGGGSEGETSMMGIG